MKGQGIRETGISVYPEFASFPELEGYVARAASLGFSRVFMSLILDDLAFEGALAPDAPVFKEAFALCRDHGLFITADINDRVFEYFGGVAAALSRLKALGAGALRVDSGLSPRELVALSVDDGGLGLEINVSGFYPGNPASLAEAGALLAVLEKEGNLSRTGGSFNFYPRRGTGLAVERVGAAASWLAGRGIKCSAFAASLDSPSVLHRPGRGICTVEALREIPPETAGAILFCEGVSTVYIGDPFASPGELEGLSRCRGSGPLHIPVVYYRECPAGIRRELAGRTLSNRSDTPRALIRGAGARGIKTPPFRCCAAAPFSVTMDNENSGPYAGEIHITLEAQGANNAVNVLGFVHPDGEALVPYLIDGSVPFVLYDYADGLDARHTEGAGNA
jgi:hypothetical protein